ncbi:MAG: HD domain-containing protein [Polyangiaceae bacterium]
MQDYLSKVPPDVFKLCERLSQSGHRAWIVGGCVRDLILGRPVNDWDLCTDAKPDELLKIFPRAIPTGIQHGTVTVVEKGEHYEVTTLRGEGAYTDGRRPDSVYFTRELTEDLARRDFTINAIALSPITGELADPFSGQVDLRDKVLRAVGVATERFSEDGLRVLRAARFAAQLEFELEPSTMSAIRPTLSTYKKVAGERIRDEWMKTMKAAKPSRAFDIMKDTGILEVTCPELMESVGCEQNKYHSYDVWGHAMACMDACPGDAILRISALMHDVGKPRSRAFSEKTRDYTFYEHERIGAEMVEPICARLRFSTDERARVTDLVRHHMWHYDGWSDAAVRRWIKRVGKDRIEDLFLLRDADVRGKGPDKATPEDFLPTQQLRAHVEKVLAEGAALSTRDLVVNGRDLMSELGMRPGPAIGRVLEGLLDDVLGDTARNERSWLLARAKELLLAETSESSKAPKA